MIQAIYFFLRFILNFFAARQKSPNIKTSFVNIFVFAEKTIHSIKPAKVKNAKRMFVAGKRVKLVVPPKTAGEISSSRSLPIEKALTGSILLA